MAKRSNWRKSAVSLRVAVLLGVALIMGACGSSPRATPVPYAVTFDVARDVNLDGSRRPSPIVLRVFELKSASAFESAEFFGLQDKPDGALGAQLLAADRVILRPGDTRTVRYPGNADARVIGVVAEYREIETKRWKLVVPLPQSGSFWPGSPREAKVQIAVLAGGIQLESEDGAHQ